MANAVAEFYDTAGRIQASAQVAPFVFQQKISVGAYAGSPYYSLYGGYTPEPIETFSIPYNGPPNPIICVTGDKKVAYIRNNNGYTASGTQAGSATFYFFTRHNGQSRAASGQPVVEIYDQYNSNYVMFDTLSRPLNIVGRMTGSPLNAQYAGIPSGRNYAVLVQNPGLAATGGTDGNVCAYVAGCYSSGGQWGVQPIVVSTALGNAAPAYTEYY